MLRDEKGRFVKGHHSTPEIIKKMSESKKGKPSPIKGIKKTYEQKMKSSKTWFKKGQKPWCTGLKLSEEHCKRLSESHLGQISPMKGRKHSEEAKRKNSIWHKENPIRYWLDKKRPDMVEWRKNFKIPLSDTKPERITQIALSLENIPYKKHIPFEMPWGFHQVDIFIEPNIAIEVDGCYWHGCVDCGYTKPEKTVKDKRVTEALQSQGLIVLRFWEHSIKSDINIVINEIKSTSYFYMNERNLKC